ncbi:MULTISPECIES: glycosyltransferase family 4 protein [unclassified Meiothermus]|uniref:glycosyltransferase family 4 protein n=1 Tax=unclassified Meiothermus TaxID=370471 RepID=UPI000D7BAD58|nr:MULTISPECIES: glycosyltransferase family 4 protein [unclassified Meiothermus]PZA07017.1 glycosyltransferase family 1 protein [Meiothermus sp. Pnk-1]RYM35281.1 glycosyltransferase family 1 protein [Meiothermus sp. PNK-Is4]
MVEVAFLTDAPRVAGSETWLLAYLPLLRQHGLEPTLYLSTHPALDGYAQRLAEAGVALRRYERLEGAFPAMGQAHLRVIQAWQPRTYGRAFAHLPRPNAAVIHDQLEYHYPYGLRPLFRLGYCLSKARALRNADALITVSEWGESHLRRLGLSKVFSVPNGVDVERFKPCPKRRPELRTGFGFRRFTVLVPGRMSPEKNPLAALSAARFSPDLDFVFVGDDDSQTGHLVKRLARVWKLENVRFWGKRWDMPALYQAADAVLQPTLAENQSLVTLEAMSSGLPVVSSPIPAQAELIRDGVEGLLVPPHPKALAKALEMLAGDPQKSNALGKAARARVLERHTLQHSVSRLAQALLGRLEEAG